MKYIFPILFISILASFSAVAQEEGNYSTELNNSIKSNQESINKLQEKLASAREEKDKALLQSQIDYEKAKKECFNGKEEMEVQICLMELPRKLAEKDNCFAQAVLGFIYMDQMKNDALALKWFKRQIENPKCHAQAPEKEFLANLEKNKSKKSEKISKDLSNEYTALEKDKKQLADEKQKAGKEKDKDWLAVLDNQAKLNLAMINCYENEEEIDIVICHKRDLKKLANDGNFAAQYALAKVYLEMYKNKKMSDFWIDKVLTNPETPELYKQLLKKKG